MYYFEKKDCEYRFPYWKIADDLNELLSTGRTGDDDEAKAIIWSMGKADLFFFTYFVLNLTPVNHPWLVPKIYQAQDSHNKTLNIWSRECYKSSLFTFALPIWKVINNWKASIGIFSWSNKIARENFLQRIKTELTNNEVLKRVWPANTDNPGGFWLNPEREAPKWSLIDGLMVQRPKGFNHPNYTFEAYGFTESMPTSAHYQYKVYDDLVTWGNSRTPEQIQKAKDGFDLTIPLGQTEGGEEWTAGTPYDFDDLYADMEESGNWEVRKYPADQLPSIWTKEQIEQKRKEYRNPYNFSCQISLNPVPNDKQKFLYDWIRWHTWDLPETNDYILVDPAKEKKKNSDYTAMWLIGVDGYKRMWVKGIVRDKLNNKEKWQKLVELIDKSSDPANIKVGYETYGMQSDIEFMEDKMTENKMYFEIIPLGGNVSKKDRIRDLISDFIDGKFLFPREYWYTDIDGNDVDLMDEFVKKEYLHFPNTSHDDMFDCLARVKEGDMQIVYPSVRKVKEKPKMEFKWWLPNFARTSTHWMTK